MKFKTTRLATFAEVEAELAAITKSGGDARLGLLHAIASGVESRSCACGEVYLASQRVALAGALWPPCKHSDCPFTVDLGNTAGSDPDNDWDRQFAIEGLEILLGPDQEGAAKLADVLDGDELL